VPGNSGLQGICLLLVFLITVLWRLRVWAKPFCLQTEVQFESTRAVVGGSSVHYWATNLGMYQRAGTDTVND
jgi:hypothetical protein